MFALERQPCHEGTSRRDSGPTLPTSTSSSLRSAGATGPTSNFCRIRQRSMPGRSPLSKPGVSGSTVSAMKMVVESGNDCTAPVRPQRRQNAPRRRPCRPHERSPGEAFPPDDRTAAGKGRCDDSGPRRLPEGDEETASASVDAIITDPPYPCIDRAYGRMTEAAWLDMMRTVVKECQRVLKPSGSSMFILQPNYRSVGSMRLWAWRVRALGCRGVEPGAGRLLVVHQRHADPFQQPQGWAYATGHQVVRVVGIARLLPQPEQRALGSVGRHSRAEMGRPLPPAPPGRPVHPRWKDGPGVAGTRWFHSVQLAALSPPPIPTGIAVTQHPRLTISLHGGADTSFRPAALSSTPSSAPGRCWRRRWTAAHRRSSASTRRQST